MAAASPQQPNDVGAAAGHVGHDDDHDEAMGFDAQFFQTIPGDYKCPICMFAQRRPCLTHCGHGFCDACLKKTIKDDKLTCPVCRAELEKSHIYPNKQNERNILNLLIKCDQQKEGCDWTGQLRQQEDHNKSCLYVAIQCGRHCEEILKRMDMIDHEQNRCPKRNVQCSHCSAEIEFQDLEEHYSQCAKLPLPCDQGCGATVSRDKIEQHKSRRGSCALNVLQCDFTNAGCDFHGTRVQLIEHCQSGMANHLGNVMETLEKQQTTMEQQKDTIRRQEKLITRLKNQLSRALVGCQVSPKQFTYMWKIENVATGLEKTENGSDLLFHSDRIYLSHPGYQVQLALKLSQAVVQIQVHLLDGDYDEMLPWPFRHQFSVSLVEQQNMGKDASISSSPPHNKCLNRPGDLYSRELLTSLDELKTRPFINGDRMFVKFSVLL